VGPEVSRQGVEGEAGVLFLLFPPGPVVRALDPLFAVGPPGPTFTGFYGVVPEPSEGLLQLAALLGIAFVAQHARRRVRERR
jgi:hypothetical protein